MTFRDLYHRPLFLPLVICILLILIWDAIPSRPLSLPARDTWKGVIAENPRLKADHSQLVIQLKTEDKSLPRKILLTTPASLASFERGDVVEWVSELKSPVPYRNLGGFDYAKFLSRQGIGATTFVRSGDDIARLSTSRSAFQKWIETLKRKTQRALQTMGSPSAQGVALALLWGDERGLDEHTEELFRNQGLSHLLVISGLHFSILALVLFGMALAPFKIFPTLCLYLSARRLAATFTLASLTLYFLFCEPNPSVTRAFIAVACYLLAIVLGRDRDAFNILFLAALLILSLNPGDLFSVSFQFSFLAVLGLLLVFPKLKSRWENVTMGDGLFSKLSRGLLDLLLINIAVFLMLTPLVVFYFYRMNLNSLFMNLWAVPLIEMLLVPLALTGFILLFVFEPVGIFFLKLTVTLLDGILGFLEWAAHGLPSPGLVFPPHGYELILYYGLVLILCLSTSSLVKRTALVACAIFLLADLFFWFALPQWQNRFRLTQIDVGQGDSILVELPRGRHLLVDGGGSTYFDVGKNVVLPYLLYQRVRKLDAVCVTHADTDHYMGLIPVVGEFPVGELWWNGVKSESLLYQGLFIAAEKKNIPLKVLAEGDRVTLDTGSLEVLSPGDPEKVAQKDNNHSLVFKIHARGHTALLTGDMEKPVEARLVQTYGEQLDADFLKIPHHGSHSSSTMDFIRAVSPQLASLGAKRGNRFGHPHADTLEKYDRLGIPVYRTDRDGAVTIDLSGENLQVTTTKRTN